MHTPCLNALLRLRIGICGIDERPSLEQEVRMEHSTEFGVLGLQVCIEGCNKINMKGHQMWYLTFIANISHNVPNDGCHTHVYT